MLRKLWFGVYPLGTTFWGFYVGGIVLSMMVATVIVLIAMSFHVSTIGFIVGFFFFWSYFFVASVGVWNSASPRTAFGFIARALIVIWGCSILVKMYNGGAQIVMQRMMAPIDY